MKLSGSSWDDWGDFTRIGVTDALTARAGLLAWQHELRGYDAAQLAAALAWRETTEGTGDEIVFRMLLTTSCAKQLRPKAWKTWPE